MYVKKHCKEKENEKRKRKRESYKNIILKFITILFP